MTEVNLHDWKPARLKSNRNILIIGRRGSGKTTLLMNVLYALHGQFDVAVAMCPTKTTCDLLARHIPLRFIHTNGYSEIQMASFLSHCQRSVERKGAGAPKYLLIWDDCMNDRKIQQSAALRTLAMNGRHLNITFINCMQYCMDIHPSIRSQMDYVLALQENIKANKERLYKYFYGMFNSAHTFYNTLDLATQNYGALVLDNTKPCLNIESVLFWYRGRPLESLPAFEIGRSALFTEWKDAAPVESLQKKAGDGSRQVTTVVLLHKDESDDPDVL